MKVKDFAWAVTHQKVESGNYILRSLLIPDCVAQIQGPWKPGSKWSMTVYWAKPELDRAWYENKLTTRQRGVSKEMDQIAAAMTWGTTNSLHPDLVDTANAHFGWQKSRVKCFDMFTTWVDAVQQQRHEERMKLSKKSPQTHSSS